MGEGLVVFSRVIPFRVIKVRVEDFVSYCWKKDQTTHKAHFFMRIGVICAREMFLQ